jgi:hypothetical protein
VYYVDISWASTGSVRGFPSRAPLRAHICRRPPEAFHRASCVCVLQGEHTYAFLLYRQPAALPAEAVEQARAHFAGRGGLKAQVGYSTMHARGRCMGLNSLPRGHVGVAVCRGSWVFVFSPFHRPHWAWPDGWCVMFVWQGWAEGAGLGSPIAAVAYVAEWDEAVDDLHAALGFVPPDQFKSPKQQAAAKSAK